MNEIKSTGCCEPFDPKPWDNKTITFKNKLFIKDHVISFLHIPLNMKSKITRNMKLIIDAKALPKEFLMLCDESLWGSDIYIHVTKDVPGANMTKISGTFLTKVFEGPYCKMGQWMKEMARYVSEKGKKFKKIYAYYTTCPKCAKAYGKNYVVLFAEI
ncbi:MAG: hypothetical protein JW855_00615 [Gammaproteobacteria bacterium]|nr:hypothetical protein [Gammaproteobacteria bacterium]